MFWVRFPPETNDFWRHLYQIENKRKRKKPLAVVQKRNRMFLQRLQKVSSTILRGTGQYEHFPIDFSR
jgi:hypothetical protein